MTLLGSKRQKVTALCLSKPSLPSHAACYESSHAYRSTVSSFFLPGSCSLPVVQDVDPSISDKGAVDDAGGGGLESSCLGLGVSSIAGAGSPPSSEGWFFLSFLRRKKNHTSSATTARPPMATPTPMPALAPVERPLEDDDAGVGVGEGEGKAEVEGVDVGGNVVLDELVEDVVVVAFGSKVTCSPL